MGRILTPRRRSVPGFRSLAVALVAFLLGSRGFALVRQYENATAGATGFVSSNGNCDSGVGALDRTFVVSDSFVVASVAVGLNVSHAERGDYRIRLLAPGGTALNLATQNTGDDSDDYDVLFSTNTEGVLDDGDDDDVAAPVYNRLVPVSGLSTFSGVASAGIWTLRLCDRSNNAVNGVFSSARLILTDAAGAAAICSSRATVSWGSFANNTNFSSATVGGVTMTETATTDVGGTGAFGASAPTFRTSTATTGNEAGYYRLWMDAANTPGTQAFEAIGQIVDFSFSVPVWDLGFALLDNDFAAGDFEDYHRMEGTRSAASVPFQVTLGSAAQAAGDVVEGDTGAGDTSTSANATYLFADAVDQLRAVYMAGDLQDEPGDQLIGIGDVSFCAFDFGDAPATYGTTLGSGARHLLGSRSVWLGVQRPDGEGDGQPAGAGADATPDDGAAVGGVDDEDGVGAFPACPQDGTYAVSVAASNATSPAADAFLVGYVDWNRDGDFADSGERSATVAVAAASADPSNFSVTWSAVPANCGGTSATYARFRIGTVPAEVESPTGPAVDGEIEDYQIPAGTLPVTISWVSSAREGAGTVVRWRTSTETGNVGFRVWGISRSGRRLLARVPSRGFDSFSPLEYEAVLAARDLTAIEIADLSVDGSPRRHGPFAVGREYGRRGGELRVDWAAIRAAADLAAGSGEGFAANGARLLIDRPGVQRVGYEELAAAGLDLAGVAAGAIALADEGRPLARHVSADPFGPGAWIEFLMAEPKRSLASPHDVVVLSVGAGGAVSPIPFTAAAGVGEARLAAVVHARPERAYGFASPTGDPWYDEALLSWGAPRVVERDFDLPDWAGDRVTLALGGWGYTDWPGDAPDHHVKVALNGVEIVSDRFDGLAEWRREIEVTGLVSPAGNRLEITVPGDTGFAFDLFAFDGFDVEYTRASRALEGVFQGAAKPSFAVTGFGSEPIVAWIAPATGAVGVRADALAARPVARVARRATAPAGAGSIVVPSGGGEVFAATPSSVARPRVVAGLPVAATASDADYLIVSHPAFRPAIGELVAFESSRGLEVDVVEVESVYAAYSDHAPSPEAIRRFLAASIATGGPRYVLLVGTDSTDAWDRLGTGAISFVPTAYLPASEFVRFAPSDEYLADTDGDRIADAAIGRLPVRTADELSEVVAKLAAWENRPGRRSALLVAGASDDGSRLVEVNERYAQALGGWPRERVEVDQLGGPAARNRVHAALNSGAPVVSFVGHSSADRWDFDPLLEVGDVASLANVGRPSLVLQWGCWNSYAFDPEYESLSSRLLLEPGVGAAGTIGATTLTADRVHDRLAVHFLDAMREGAATTLGEALREAKLRLKAEGAASDDVLLGVAILGDPASTLPFDE